MRDFLGFKARVRSQQTCKGGLTYADIERITKENGANNGKGYSCKSIEKFMCEAYVGNDDRIVQAIAEALDISDYEKYL